MAPALGADAVDHFSREITNSIYAGEASKLTAVDANIARECRSCAAFFPTDTGRGECHRYAPKPDFEHTFAVEWPQLPASDFGLEFVSRGGE